MRIVTMMNRLPEMNPERLAARTMSRAANLGHDVLVADVTALDLDPDGRVTARVCQVTSDGRLGDHRVIDLAECDLIWLRTNPARDTCPGPLHEVVLSLARIVRDRGSVVINDPDGLERAASKIYLTEVPAIFRPRTLVSFDRDSIISFVRSGDGLTVLKPIHGTHGRDVFRVGPESVNLSQIVDVLLRQGYAMAQEYLPEAPEGDVRVFVVNGELLETKRAAAAIRRVPGRGEFRSNIHAGGHVAPASVTDGMRAAVKAIGPRLQEDGLVVAGFDFIGDRICEINVFSPGGLADIEQHTGEDFTGLLLDRLLENVPQP